MKLFVATPMYGGQCHGGYCDSIARLAVECSKRNIEFRFCPVFNESHIDRGRNTCVHEFLKTDFTHLFFIDSDIQFPAPESLDLLALDKPVISGLYSKKNIRWDQIVAAVRLGWADGNPNILEQFVGDMVFNPLLEDKGEVRSIYELTPIMEGGTGFIIIKREVLERIRELHPDRRYHKTGANSEFVHCFFDAHISDYPYRRHLSEDYAFCELVREAGFPIYLAPWVSLVHSGMYQWIANVEAIGRIMMKEGPPNAKLVA